MKRNRSIKNNHVYLGSMLITVLLMGISCKDEEYKLGDVVYPTHVEINYDIVGITDTTPTGDGSGEVTFAVSSENAFTYKFDFGDGYDAEIVPSGEVTHTFSETGENTYKVTVYAIGTGGLTATQDTSVAVLSTFSDDEAVKFLTGENSKKWYWAADQTGHIGLGPNYVDGTNHTYAAWYNAAAFEKTCMYDAEFVFTKTENGVTFEQTAGTSYIPGTYAGKLGVDGNQCHGTDVINPYGEKNVSFAPANSIATIDGGYRGTSFTLSNGGYMCWYVGVSTYEIIEISENLLKVRIEEDSQYAWYQILTTTKPEQ